MEGNYPEDLPISKLNFCYNEKRVHDETCVIVTYQKKIQPFSFFEENCFVKCMSSVHFRTYGNRS